MDISLVDHYVDILVGADDWDNGRVDLSGYRFTDVNLSEEEMWKLVTYMRATFSE